MDCGGTGSPGDCQCDGCNRSRTSVRNGRIEKQNLSIDISYQMTLLNIKQDTEKDKKVYEARQRHIESLDRIHEWLKKV
jgi:hypothetical protein